MTHSLRRVRKPWLRGLGQQHISIVVFMVEDSPFEIHIWLADIKQVVARLVVIIHSCYQIHGILLATKYVTNTWKKSKNRRACPSINQTRGNQFVMLYSIWITFMLADILSFTRYLFLFCRILNFMLLFWIFVLLDITNMLPQIHKWLVRYYKIVSVSWYIFC